ncbi:MAG: transglycosylase SLT domain-containing protein [Longimicrobiales bacterium]
MTTRRWLLATGITLIVSLAVMGPGSTQSVPVSSRDVPDSALVALREGRYLRASHILQDYLATQTDSTPDAILYSAQAAAGLGDWERVEGLLANRSWLDSIGAGNGWDLLGRSQLQLGHFDESGRSFSRYLKIAQNAGQRAKGIGELRIATAFVSATKYDSAIAAYDRAAKLLPQIQDWIDIFAAAAAASKGDTTAVRIRLDSTDGTLARDWGWRSRVRAKQNAGDMAGAAAAARYAATLLPSKASRAEAWLRVAEIRAKTGDTEDARRAYREAMTVNPGTGSDAALALTALGGYTARDQLLMGRVYLRNGNSARGIASLRAYTEQGNLGQEEQRRLQLEVGRALFNAGRYEEAAVTLRAYAKSAMDETSAADALYTAIRATYRLGNEEAARALVLHVISVYPGTKGAASAAFLYADLDHDDGNLDSATAHYRRTIEIAPASDEAGLARMRLAGISYASGNHAAALKEYESYLLAFPDGKRAQQAMYWSAQSLRETGQADSANKLLRTARRADPFTYYGDLAAEQLNAQFWSVPLAKSPASDPALELQVENALARVDLLKELGWNEAAATEMQRARTHFTGISNALYPFAEALNKRGFASSGIALGWDIRRRDGSWNKRLLRIIYPFPYQNLIVAEARDRGVDPYLAAGLIRQESMFNPRARSGAGAMGLMQVMPATGKILAKSLNIRKFQPVMLETPEVNIHIGMAYLKDQLSTWSNKPARFLAAYNAGPTRVERWRAFPEWSNDELFTERIPYEETRDYVKIVQHNARMYEALYGAAQPAVSPQD